METHEAVESVGHDALVSNSNEYWSKRFDGDWEARSGRAQSRFFYRLALQHLPAWLQGAIRRDRLTLLDWGCALGDGTDLLAEAWETEVTGIDFAENAIENAKRTYKRPRFLAADLTVTVDDVPSFDITFTSNTLEHFPQPWDIARNLCKVTNHAFVIVVPFQERERHHEHEYTFESSNIPMHLEQFILVHAFCVDANLEPNPMWGGLQILLVYSSLDFIKAQCLTLESLQTQVSLEFFEAKHSLSALNEKETRIKDLIHAKEDVFRVREEVIHRDFINQRLSEELEGIGRARIALEQRLEGEIRARDALASRASELDSRASELEGSLSWRATAPLRRIGSFLGLSPRR